MPYNTVPIPEGKNPRKFTFHERRAEILKLIVEAGHPGAISQSQLAKRYGKSQPQIHEDIKAIGEEIVKDMGTDADFIIHTVFNKAIKRAAGSPSIKDNIMAAKTAKDWADYLMDSGVKQRAPQEIQVNDSLRTALYEELDIGADLRSNKKGRSKKSR